MKKNEGKELTKGKIPKSAKWVIVIVLLLCAGGTYACYRLNEWLRNAYTAWWAADMVIEHLENNNGDWPEEWSDLKDDYMACVKRSGQPWSFAEIKRRVVIDWSVNSQQMDSAVADEDLNIQWFELADGSQDFWVEENPNDKVLRYLRYKAKQSRASFKNPILIEPLRPEIGKSIGFGHFRRPSTNKSWVLKLPLVTNKVGFPAKS